MTNPVLTERRELARQTAETFDWTGAAGRRVELVDAGAGFGQLTLAAIDAAGTLPPAGRPDVIRCTLIETNPTLATLARQLIADCSEWARERGITVSGEVLETDFMKWRPPNDANDSGAAAAHLMLVHPPDGMTWSPERQARVTGEKSGKAGDRNGRNPAYLTFIVHAIECTPAGGWVTCLSQRTWQSHPKTEWFRQRLRRAVDVQRAAAWTNTETLFNEQAVVQRTIAWEGRGRDNGGSSPNGEHESPMSVTTYGNYEENTAWRYTVRGPDKWAEEQLLTGNRISTLRLDADESDDAVISWLATQQRLGAARIAADTGTTKLPTPQHRATPTGNPGC